MGKSTTTRFEEDWITKYGSPHLQRLLREGLACHRILRDEYVRQEFPGWVVVSEVKHRAGKARYKFRQRRPLSPSPEDIALLDAAREEFDDATLDYWVLAHKANVLKAMVAVAQVTDLPSGPVEVALLRPADHDWVHEHLLHPVHDGSVVTPFLALRDIARHGAERGGDWASDLAKHVLGDLA